MKKGILIIVTAALMIGSCSEGDIIDVDVNFDAEISSCGNDSANTFVIYKINNTTKELLSFGFTSSSFDLNKNFDEPVVIDLNNSTNRLLYRKLNAEIDGKLYFCSSVPPTENNVIEELISENGTATISYEKVEESDTMYTRTITLENITLARDGIALRKEIFELGSETFEVTQ